MSESTASPKSGETHLCVIAEQEARRFDLYRSDETFLIRDASEKAADRTFDTLPALLAGLQSFFLEFRLAGSPLKGLAELSDAQEKAKADVLEASRRIYAALDEAK
jgi:hypothetical protein